MSLSRVQLVLVIDRDPHGNAVVEACGTERCRQERCSSYPLLTVGSSRTVRIGTIEILSVRTIDVWPSLLEHGEVECCPQFARLQSCMNRLKCG